MAHMRISEIFYSLQGEGLYSGLPMTFIRLQGCPFRCRWCDSEYTWNPKGGDELSLETVLAKVRDYPTKHVCITGGEPLAQPRDFLALTRALHERGYWQEVETSGGYALPMQAPVDSWVLDIKCPGSGMEAINKYTELARLRDQDQVKFVVATRADFDFAREVLAKHETKAAVLFSPVFGETNTTEIAEWLKEAGLPNARLSLQLHKVLWPGVTRGV